MTNNQIISGFVGAQEKLLHTKQSSGFYDTRKKLAFNTNYLYVKEGNFSELKPIAKTYFVHSLSGDGYVLRFEILCSDEKMPKRQQAYLEELKRQIMSKYYYGAPRDKRITNVAVTEVAAITQNTPKLVDIIEETK